MGEGSEKLTAIKARRLDMGGAEEQRLSDTQLKQGHRRCVCGSEMSGETDCF